MNVIKDQEQQEIKTEAMLETPILNLSLLLKVLALRNKEKEEK